MKMKKNKIPGTNFEISKTRKYGGVDKSIGSVVVTSIDRKNKTITVKKINKKVNK